MHNGGRLRVQCVSNCRRPSVPCRGGYFFFLLLSTSSMSSRWRNCNWISGPRYESKPGADRVKCFERKCSNKRKSSIIYFSASEFHTRVAFTRIGFHISFCNGTLKVKMDSKKFSTRTRIKSSNMRTAATPVGRFEFRQHRATSFIKSLARLLNFQ